MATDPPTNDFNGDGRSDILWRNNDGWITSWLGTANGGFATAYPHLNWSLPETWTVVATGDFNGDGRVDILLRHSFGFVLAMESASDGSFIPNWENPQLIAADWAVVGAGDFNGDGISDVLVRNTNGAITNWLGHRDTSVTNHLGDLFGRFSDNSANAANQVSNDWKIAGIADFNGDGKDDILWRSTSGDLTNWLGQQDGGFALNPNAAAWVATNWHVVSTGDFNGDGRDDILWRSDVGDLTSWLGQANGGFAANSNASTWVATSWQVAETGDFNGDGRDDILWRNEDGNLTSWLGETTGAFLANSNASTWVPISWHVQLSNGSGAGDWDY